MDKLYCYSASEEEQSWYDKKEYYSGNKIEVEWKMIEFLQIRFSDWEKQIPLSEEEKGVMSALSEFAVHKEQLEQYEETLLFLFDGDVLKVKEFLEANRNKESSFIFDKPTLNKVWKIADRMVLTKQENAKFCT